MSCIHRLQRKIEEAKTSQDCLDIAKEIYDYIQTHKDSALENKKVTFHILEAKKSERKC